jgi:hypothetical protein
MNHISQQECEDDFTEFVEATPTTSTPAEAIIEPELNETVKDPEVQKIVDKIKALSKVVHKLEKLQ